MHVIAGRHIQRNSKKVAITRVAKIALLLEANALPKGSPGSVVHRTHARQKPARKLVQDAKLTITACVLKLCSNPNESQVTWQPKHVR